MITLPIALTPLDWHVHEMVYGYVPAIVAGFLLTSIPNWTGRLPLAGWPLIGLVLLWLAGRMAMAASGSVGLVPTATLDSAFLTVFTAVCLREIVAGRNWRNLRVLLGLGTLTLGNLLFHVEAIIGADTGYGTRVGIAAAISMIMLVGGRIVPSFTRNWLHRENPGRLPAPFDSFDVIAMATAIAALAAWVCWPLAMLSGVLLGGAGALQAIRLARWAGHRTVREPLLLVLHVGYAFVPLGFGLGALALLTEDVPVTAAIHAWTVGAVGIMTLAVMTRATLGHTGRQLTTSSATTAIYALVCLAAAARIGAGLGAPIVWLYLAAAAWIAAFIGFAVTYGSMVVRPKSSANRQRTQTG
jgi:uncharacterized protein involved in response to NO